MDFTENVSKKTTTTTTTTTCSSGCSGSGGLLTDCSPLVINFLPNTCSEEQFSALCDEYERSIGNLSLFIKARIKEWLGTLDIFSISYAIGEAAGAPRPSWRYCEAILLRLYREGARSDDMVARPSQQRVPPRKIDF